ncbi:12132_t:CDS:2, partial [Acaulospora morrowiae]
SPIVAIEHYGTNDTLDIWTSNILVGVYETRLRDSTIAVISFLIRQWQWDEYVQQCACVSLRKTNLNLRIRGINITPSYDIFFGQMINCSYFLQPRSEKDKKVNAWELSIR